MVISPGPGRVVHFYPATGDDLHDGDPAPYAAHVAYVWNDRLVNLMVIDRKGYSLSRTSVSLVQPDEPAPDCSYCTWMPFQVDQARKHAPPPNTEPQQAQTAGSA